MASMAPRRITDDQLLDRLTDVFRSGGYDGASLSDLAAVTGLQKSSLYHRFPGGKEQMATEVVERLGTGPDNDASAPCDADQPMRARVVEVGRALTAFYEAGAKSCLLDTLSVGDPGSTTAAALAAATNRWITAFARIAASTGVKPAAARARAQDAIGSIEGALVLARVTGDRRPFARAIERLPDVLLGTESNTNRTSKEQ
jgi:TetR/AcrR family transcriptional regulator, lmrAB and yxaGH operons repressor